MYGVLGTTEHDVGAVDCLPKFNFLCSCCLVCTNVMIIILIISPMKVTHPCNAGSLNLFLASR